MEKLSDKGLLYESLLIGIILVAPLIRSIPSEGAEPIDYGKMVCLRASDGSIRFIQPTESVLEGVVTFRIEHKYNVTGVIGDVERKFLLKVQPRDAHVEGDRETFAMKIVGRTILDFPNYAVFIDTYESTVDTTVFYDGWQTVEVVYLEDGEQVDSISADFYFKNGNEPLPEPSTINRALIEIASILLLITIASLAGYLLYSKRRSRIKEA